MRLEQIKAFVDWAMPKISGGQVQKVWTYDQGPNQGLVLEIYKQETFHLVMDLTQNAPGLYLLRETPKRKVKAKPVGVFLNAHLKNRRLTDVVILSDLGRVIQFLFISPVQEMEIVCELIPKSVNLQVKLTQEGETKGISWNKPRELPPSNLAWDGQSDQNFDGEQMALAFQRGALFNTSEKPKIALSSAKEQIEKNIFKKRQAITKIAEQNFTEEISCLRELGDWMKWNEKPPPHLLKLYESFGQQISKSELIADCFAKAKSLEKKMDGAQQRMKELDLELQKLEQQLVSEGDLQNVSVKAEDADSLSKVEAFGRFLKKHDIHARKIELGDEMVGFYGKSARDNLALLRHAPPWSLWVHLRDYPSSHAIILHAKGRQVPDSYVQKAAQTLIEQHETKKNISSGVKYAVVTTETRYVKPIKGDAIGRVTYHNFRVFNLST